MQPLTVGTWRKSLGPLVLEQSDVITYHRYADHEGQREAIAAHKAHGRPLICTEWFARARGSRFDKELPLFKDERVGCYSWGLVNGRTQCQFSWWNKPGDGVAPEGWFHDILHGDGRPYQPEEVEAIGKVTADKTLDWQGAGGS